MENTEKPMEQYVISILLIMVIFVVAMVFLTCTFVDNNHEWLNWMLVFPILTVLMAGYVFTYRGREQLTARIIFAVFIILSIVGVFIYGSMLGLAAAFSHG
jgi:cytochrome bd-type quinol oxidase subunit 2